MDDDNLKDLDMYSRQKSGIFREKVLEIYARNRFPGQADQLFQTGLDDGSYELNYKEFEQLLRFWGSSKIATEKSDNGMGILEIVARYGSAEDLNTLSSFTDDWIKDDIANIQRWAEESGNTNISNVLNSV